MLRGLIGIIMKDNEANIFSEVRITKVLDFGANRTDEVVKKSEAVV